MRGRLQTPVFGAVVATALASAAPAPAQEHPPAVAGPPAPRAAHAQGHAAGHASHRHHVSVLLGAAHNGHIDETGFTVGAGYRYALSDRFAIGPMVDFAFYDSENTALLVGCSSGSRSATFSWSPARESATRRCSTPSRSGWGSRDVTARPGARAAGPGRSRSRLELAPTDR